MENLIIVLPCDLASPDHVLPGVLVKPRNPSHGRRPQALCSVQLVHVIALHAVSPCGTILSTDGILEVLVGINTPI